MAVLTRLRNAIAEKVVSTAYLEQEKAKWEQQLVDANNDEFDNNELAISDANEELEWINRELARRQVAR